MKIQTKADLKALIKECLIEILSDGNAPSRTKMRLPRESDHQTEFQSEAIMNVPQSLRSLARDSQTRMFEQTMQEVSQKEKQIETLGSMAKTWENMTFTGAPLPTRAMNPDTHRGTAAHTLPPNVQDDFVDGFDDGFDPYEVVKAARTNRK